ncbi:MAG: hypothetical protein Tsb0018_01810 [Opitutales bacterium]|tara:strand:+ start:7157 stop:8041 length:885 start_codon:yes stop_codon:yes gene_type:complete
MLMAVNICLIAVFSLSVALTYANLRWASTACAILNRWIRWLLFSWIIALMSHQYEWTDRPVWLIFVTAFLIWFLVETIYNWLLIGVLSRSTLPLFPAFTDSNKDGQWPIQRKFLKLKNEVINFGFGYKCSLNAKYNEHFCLSSSVYEHKDNHMRLQIIFVPWRGRATSPCFVLSSISDSGDRLITDNIYLPFGGFYPKQWNLSRRPTTGSLTRLLALHKKRLQKKKFKSVSWEEDPVEDLNYQSKLLEKINMEAGFLLPHDAEGTKGRITWEGRYRMWKEIWLLNYLGIPCKYS